MKGSGHVETQMKNTRRVNVQNLFNLGWSDAQLSKKNQERRKPQAKGLKMRRETRNSENLRNTKFAGLEWLMSNPTVWQETKGSRSSSVSKRNVNIMKILVGGRADFGLDETQCTDHHQNQQVTQAPKIITAAETSNWTSNALYSVPLLFSPDFRTLVSKWNAKFTFIWKEDFGQLSNSPERMLLMWSLVQKWIDIMNAAAVAPFLETPVRA